ncbi:hypothetical protein [Streptomyces sp. B6B3]|uniref:hypothetical protein n=1 Tax=Streptomyces sp. B6B3 TaxID=3153570 RepID=UPI00325E85F5
MSLSRAPHPRLAAALGAAGAAVLLVVGTSACQVVERARAGAGVAGAVDELLAWEAVTLEAGVDASADQVYDYLLRTAAGGSGGEEPSRDDARRLAELDLTTAIGAPDGRTAMRDLEPYTSLNSAMVMSFGGDDVTGLKNINGVRYARADVAALVEDALHGDEATVAEAERFVQEASRVPDSLAVPGAALAGDWVEVDPYRYDDYTAALVEGESRVEPETAEAFAGALTDAGDLLTANSLWGFVEGLESALRGDATLEPAGEERGAELLRAELPAGDAWRALEPLLTLLTEQSARFGMPPLVAEPADDAAAEPVTAELTVRNGVLTGIAFDLAQFAPGGAEAAGGAGLPLSLDLTGGSALSLTAPASGGPLQPEDLTVALLYLADRAEDQTADPDRADIPGPMQPGS